MSVGIDWTIVAIPVAIVVGILIFFLSPRQEKTSKGNILRTLFSKPTELTCWHCGQSTPAEKAVCEHCGKELK